jgi:dihydrofolate synthase / folylpolyglutamate synthase
VESRSQSSPVGQLAAAHWGLPPPDETVSDAAYVAALTYLYSFSATPRGAAAIRADQPRKLARMRRLLALCGDPQQRYPAVLIAGTKGKGSTAAMLAAILRASGLRVGRYTQPHLLSFRERTWVDGEYVGPDAVVELATELRPLVQAAERQTPDLGHYTTFEVGTALTFLHFARARADLAVVEVGVGGTHDATNVLDPLVSLIAPISADHLDTLGPTIADVACAKAGILRAHRPAVFAPQPAEAVPILEAEAARLGAPATWLGREWRWLPEAEPVAASPFTLQGPAARYDHLNLPLLGRHQRDNAALAVAAAHALGTVGVPVRPAAVAPGLASVAWPGRIQVLPTSPTLVVDGAHNAASATSLGATLAECFPNRPITLVLGCTADKDLAGIVHKLAPLATCVVATRTRHPRAAAAESIAAAAQGTGAAVVVTPDVPAALAAATSAGAPDALVVVAGSLFLAGEALAYAATLPPTR